MTRFLPTCSWDNFPLHKNAHFSSGVRSKCCHSQLCFLYYIICVEVSPLDCKVLADESNILFFFISLAASIWSGFPNELGLRTQGERRDAWEMLMILLLTAQQLLQEMLLLLQRRNTSLSTQHRTPPKRSKWRSFRHSVSLKWGNVLWSGSKLNGNEYGVRGCDYSFSLLFSSTFLRLLVF